MIQVPSLEVIQSCEQVIRFIVLYNAQMKAELLKTKANEYVSFLGFNKRKLGYEKAHLQLQGEKAELYCSEHYKYNYNVPCYTKEYIEAKRLLLLANNVNPVSITAEHSFIFKDWNY